MKLCNGFEPNISQLSQLVGVEHLSVNQKQNPFSLIGNSELL